MSNGWRVRRGMGPAFFCLKAAGGSGACLYAHAADVLADNVLLPEFIKFFIATEVVKIGRIFFDGLGRTRQKASSAFSAGSLYGLIGLQREVRQHSHQAEPGSELRIDQEIVASDPA